MIKATKIKTNDKDGYQVEAMGDIMNLMMEYKAIRMTIEGEKNERSV